MQGLQLAADLKVLMGPFDTLARRRPEKHFLALAEAAVLLSLEKVTVCASGLIFQQHSFVIANCVEIFSLHTCCIIHNSYICIVNT